VFVDVLGPRTVPELAVEDTFDAVFAYVKVVAVGAARIV
jgi:hypothetical protein